MEDVDILLAHRLTDHDGRLGVGEFADRAVGEWNAQPLHDLLGQVRVAAPGEDLDVPHNGHAERAHRRVLVLSQCTGDGHLSL